MVKQYHTKTCKINVTPVATVASGENYPYWAFSIDKSYYQIFSKNIFLHPEVIMSSDREVLRDSATLFHDITLLGTKFAIDWFPGTISLSLLRAGGNVWGRQNGFFRTRKKKVVR